MVCVRCKRDSNTINTGEAVVAEVSGVLDNEKSIESQIFRASDSQQVLAFNGVICHIDCYIANKEALSVFPDL